jgi:perosamine synthetase
MLENWITQGHYVDRFEKEFASFIGVNHAIAVSSGTSALHLAMIAMSVKPGDAVLIPALTYIATANAVTYMGGTPVCCDVDKLTWNLDPVDVKAKYEKLSKAGVNVVGIIPVHLYGNPCDMSSLLEFARANSMWVVEDAAEAHGGMFDFGMLGSFGAVNAFSFYGNKIITTGEGGMVTTDDDVIANTVRLYRGQGQGKLRYRHDVVGYNYRMTDLQAAIGCAQLSRINEFKSIRHRIWSDYASLLTDFERQLRPIGSAHWLFSLLVPENCDRDGVMRYMSDRGIETRPVFPTIASQWPYAENSQMTIAHDIAARGISLPTHVNLEVGDTVFIASTFKSGVRACKRNQQSVSAQTTTH